MKSFFLFYLIQISLKRIKIFLKDWYINGFISFWDFLLRILNRLDKTFAIKITIRHWLEPLYQDRTIVGYILGFIFRTLRIFIASFIYFFIAIFIFFCYFIWASIPLFLLIKGVK